MLSCGRNRLIHAEFSNFLRSVKCSHSSVFICRDFNINLLSIKMKAHFADYFESVLAAGFFPNIPLPHEFKITTTR